jgi:hypothetical protein
VNGDDAEQTDGGIVAVQDLLVMVEFRVGKEGHRTTVSQGARETVALVTGESPCYFRQ